MSALIEIKNLTKSFTSSQNTVTVLKNVNLSINSGEIYGIIGLSGAGKSTLIRCMNFLEVPTGGQVIFDGNDLGQMTERELRKARQSMGMIFQQFQLLAQRNVLQNVCFPLELQGMDKKKREEKARELLKIVDLADKEKAYPSQLPVEQQRHASDGQDHHRPDDEVDHVYFKGSVIAARYVVAVFRQVSIEHHVPKKG